MPYLGRLLGGYDSLFDVVVHMQAEPELNLSCDDARDLLKAEEGPEQVVAEINNYLSDYLLHVRELFTQDDPASFWLVFVDESQIGQIKDGNHPDITYAGPNRPTTDPGKGGKTLALYSWTGNKPMTLYGWNRKEWEVLWKVY